MRFCQERFAANGIRRVIAAKARSPRCLTGHYEKDLLQYVSLRTMVDPEDIAAMILFLAFAGGSADIRADIGVDGNFEWED